MGGMINTAGSSRAFSPDQATTLRDVPAAAARYIQRVGWTQGSGEVTDTKKTLTAALRWCAPTVADGFIAREVFRRRGRAEEWNDVTGRTQSEVVAYLAGSEITDDDLAATFGSQWQEIIGVVHRSAGFRPDELLDLRDASFAWNGWDAWYITGLAAWFRAEPSWPFVRDASKARDVVREVARDAAGKMRSGVRDADWSFAWAAVSYAGMYAFEQAYPDDHPDAEFDAQFEAKAPVSYAVLTRSGDPWSDVGIIAWLAVTALVVRDLIGQHDFTQEHYDLLTSLWRATIGPLHSEDADLGKPVLAVSRWSAWFRGRYGRFW